MIFIVGKKKAACQKSFKVHKINSCSGKNKSLASKKIIHGSLFNHTYIKINSRHMILIIGKKRRLPDIDDINYRQKKGRYVKNNSRYTKLIPALGKIIPLHLKNNSR